MNVQGAYAYVCFRVNAHDQLADVFEASVLHRHGPCADRAAQSFVGGLYADQGLASVQTWVNALFRPYAEAAYDVVRAQHGDVALGALGVRERLT